MNVAERGMKFSYSFRGLTYRLVTSKRVVLEKMAIKSPKYESRMLREVHRILTWWPEWSEQRKQTFTKITGFSKPDLEWLRTETLKRTKAAIAAHPNWNQLHAARNEEIVAYRKAKDYRQLGSGKSKTNTPYRYDLGPIDHLRFEEDLDVNVPSQRRQSRDHQINAAASNSPPTIKPDESGESTDGPAVSTPKSTGPA